MPALFLYLAATAVLLALWTRWVLPLSRVAMVVLVLLPVLFTGRALLTGRVYAPVDLPFASEPLKDYAKDFGVTKQHNGTMSDLYAQMIPWQQAVRLALQQGESPLLNPYLLCGSILAANAQAAPWDPVHVIGRILPLDQALTFSAAMTFFFAALFTFAFARALGIGEAAALVAAAGYTFCGILSFFVGWPLARSWSYLPLVMLGVRLVVKEASLRGAIILTLALAAVNVAGHPESILHVVASGLAYGIFELIVTREKRLRALLLAVGAGVVALLLTAIALLPFLAASRHTRELQTRLELPRPAASRAVVAKRTGIALFPFYGGQPWRGPITPQWDSQAARVGSIVLALALAALVAARRRKEMWFFAGLAVVCLFAAVDAGPVAHWLHKLPLFDMALNERLAYTACLALAILAGMCLDGIARAKLDKSARSAAFIALFVLIAITIASHYVAQSQIAAGVDAALIRELILAELIPLALVVVLLFLQLDKRIVVPAILVLVLIQRTIEDGGIYPAVPRKAFYPDIPILEELQRRSAVEPPFRMAGLFWALVPDTAALYGLEDARGYEAMTFRRLSETYPLWSTPQPVSFNLIDDKSRPFLSFLNVKYVIGSLDPVPDDQWKLILQDRQSRLLENTRVLPRAFVPRRVRYEKWDTDVLRGMLAERDFAERAWILAPEYPRHEISNGPGTVQLRRDGLAYDLTATMEEDGWVVVSNVLWPGWRAYIDGKRVGPRYANHAFLGVFVPKGKHHVRLVYLPEAYTRGRAVSVATVAILGLTALIVLARRRKQATSH